MPVRMWEKVSVRQLVNLHLTEEKVFLQGIAQLGASLNAWERKVETYLEGYGNWGVTEGLNDIGCFARDGDIGAIVHTLGRVSIDFHRFLLELDIIEGELDRVTAYIIMSRSWWGNGPPIYL